MTINIFNAKINIKKEQLFIISIFLAIFILLITYIALKDNGGVIIDNGQQQTTEETDNFISSENSSENKKEEPKGEADHLQNTENINQGENSKHVKDEIDMKEPQPKSQQGGREIKVYIIGCVNNPGIYTLKEGQLLYEAIEAAGGVTEEADLQNINMVYPLTQNIMMNILPKNSQGTEVAEENKIDNKDEAGSGVQIIRDTGDGIIKFTSKEIGSDKNNTTDNIEADIDNSVNVRGKININIASVDELATLPGIGRSIAENIVEYRKSKGKFSKIEDIMNVTGIKEKRFDQIKNFITVD